MCKMLVDFDRSDRMLIEMQNLPSNNSTGTCIYNEDL
jgi:hypothetical protein